MPMAARWALCWLCLVAAVEAAKDFLGVGEPEPGVPPDCGNAWPQSLTDKKYTDHRYVGMGASACVFLAKAPDGAEVAVKISKEKGAVPFREFTRACGSSHALRLEACKKGMETLNLHEAFIPTCLEVGKAADMPYQIMHAAPSGKMSELGTAIPEDTDARKKLAAQLAGGLYALHHLGKAHNDLHGENIVFDKSTTPPQLAVIDLDEVSPLAQAHVVGYKRDGNAVWRWMAELAQCEPKAQWKEGEKGDKDAFLNCLKTAWGVDDVFKDAMAKIADADLNDDREQHVEGLFNTEFVKNNTPPLTSRYAWKGSEGCVDWNESHFNKVESEANYSAHYKCDSVPTYKNDPNMACANHESKAACFSTRKDVYWSCGSGLDPRISCTTLPLPPGHGDHTYDGACLVEGHSGYEFAMKWGGDEVSPDPDPEPGETTAQPAETTTTIAEETTITTTTKEEDQGSGGGLLMLLIKVLLVLAALGLIWFLVKDRLWPPAAPLQEVRAPQMAGAGAVEMNSRASRSSQS